MIETLCDRPTRHARTRSMLRDLTWGRPIFKAPDLPNPRIVFDPIPFRFLHPEWPRYATRHLAR